MDMLRRTLLIALFIALAANRPLAAAAKPRQKAPVKVFILGGQSNMQGKGRIEGEEPGTLRTLVTSSATAEKYKHLVDKKGEWVVRDDVTFFWSRGLPGAGADPELDLKGGLTVGYGGKDNHIGPELQFGHAVGDFFDEPVLIIKTAWGGKSLGIDFRPPSAGKPEYEIKDKKSGKNREVGIYYREMIADVKDVLANLGTYFPQYKGRAYEIAGFGWHQGWNDGCSDNCIPEYESNLRHFVKDVRKELGVSDLPFVIASTGMGGEEWKGVSGRIKKTVELAQIEVANSTENASGFRTRGFWIPKDRSPSGDMCHWNQNAGVYFRIGDEMAKHMIKLIEKSGKTPSTQSANENSWKF